LGPSGVEAGFFVEAGLDASDVSGGACEQGYEHDGAGEGCAALLVHSEACFLGMTKGGTSYGDGMMYAGYGISGAGTGVGAGVAVIAKYKTRKVPIAATRRGPPKARLGCLMGVTVGPEEISWV